MKDWFYVKIIKDVNWVDFKGTLLKVLIITCFSLILTININVENSLKNLCNFIVNTLINFGITFSAFTITAFSLIQLIKEKEWFPAFKTIPLYSQLISGFKFAVEITIFSIFYALFAQILLSIVSNRWLYLVVFNLSVFIISFSTIWVWICTKLLIKVIAIKK